MRLCEFDKRQSSSFENLNYQSISVKIIKNDDFKIDVLKTDDFKIIAFENDDSSKNDNFKISDFSDDDFSDETSTFRRRAWIACKLVSNNIWILMRLRRIC